MNLNILPTNVMLAHGEQWLGNPDLRAQIDASQLGAALINELERVHERLSGQVSRRRALAIALTQLTDAISAADVDHDSLARAIHFALEALMAGARDAAEVERYRRLQALLFPEGLSIVSRTYSYEAGAIKALQTRVSAEDVAELATITVGDTTLGAWYAGWIASGQTLGRQVHEREALYTSAGRGGSAVEAVDIRAARLDWVGTVHTFVGAIGLMNLDQATRERILGPLEASIDQALRSRANRASDEDSDDDLPGDELPGDELPGDEPPGDELPGDEPPGDELPGDEPPGDEPANS